MRRIQYFVMVDSDDERIRVDFETDQGEVIALHVVQYETRHEGEWQPVARYDTAHGFFHLRSLYEPWSDEVSHIDTGPESIVDICNRRFKD